MGQISCTSKLVGELMRDNKNPRCYRFIRSGERFTIDPVHVVNYFMEYGINHNTIKL